jgi:type 1 glutamine amidotransferase/HEAT repeat protein
MKWALSVLLLASAALAAGPSDDEIAKIAAAAPEAAPAKPAAPRTVLIFSRNEGFNHTSIPYGAKAFETLGTKTGAWKSVHSTDLSILSPEGLKPFDAIILNNGYQWRLPPAGQAALLDFVRSGKGLVAVHAASANFEGWPAGTQLIGARFKTHPWVPKAVWSFKNEDPTNPLNAAFAGQDFKVQDEIYTFTDFHREQLHVLLSLDLSDPLTAREPHTESYVPVAWVFRLGAGRVFYCSLGHQHEIFMNPTLLRFELAGIQYALGDLAAPDAPDRDWPARALASGAEAYAREALDALQRQIGEAAGDPAARGRIEAALLDVLRSEAPADNKRRVFQPLSLVASNAAVPVTAPLLTDPALAHGARLVLTRLATPAAAKALRAALYEAKGALLAGLIGSLGDLGDRGAVAPIAAALGSGDPVVTAAALRALGRIGGPQALAALRAAKPPADLADLRADALAVCADRLRAEGSRDAALETYLVLADAVQPARTRVLGLAGLTACDWPGVLDLLAAALKGGDPLVALTAARLLAKVQGAGAAQNVAPIFPDLSPALQAVVLTSLGERGQAEAAPLVTGALGSPDAGVRRAALAALGAVGDAAAVAPLAAAAGDEPVARAALVQLRGAGVDEAVARLAAEGDPAQRLLAVGVLGDRHAVTALPLLLKLALGEPKLAAAALKALGKVGGPAQIEPLTGLTADAADKAARAAGQTALIAVLKRLPDPPTGLGPVLAALPLAPVSSRCALLEVLGEVGGQAALEALVKATRAAQPEVRQTALACLAESFDDPRALDPLAALARDADPALATTGRRGWLRLLAAGVLSPDDTVARLKAAPDLLTRPEDRVRALGILGGCPTPAAIALAASWLDDRAVMAQAAATVLDLAKVVKGPEAEAAAAKAQEARDASLPTPWRGRDLGAVTPPGLASFADGKFSILAAGADIWGTADACHFVYQPLAGDGTIVAHLLSLKPTDPWAKAGVMIRGSLEAGAPYAFCGVSPTNGGVMQWRLTAGAESNYLPSPAAPPYWVKLARAGDEFTAWLSKDGQEWLKVGTQTVSVGREALVGLAVTAHNGSAVTEGVFEGVAVTAGK